MSGEGGNGSRMSVLSREVEVTAKELAKRQRDFHLGKGGNWEPLFFKTRLS